MHYRLVGEEISTHRRIIIPNWEASDQDSASQKAREIGIKVLKLTPLNAPKAGKHVPFEETDKEGKCLSSKVKSNSSRPENADACSGFSIGGASSESEILSKIRKAQQGAEQGVEHDEPTVLTHENISLLKEPESEAMIYCPVCFKSIREITRVCPECHLEITPEIVASVKKQMQKEQEEAENAAEQANRNAKRLNHAVAAGILILVGILAYCSFGSEIVRTSTERVSYTNSR
jgi:hypothetical protein